MSSKDSVAAAVVAPCAVGVEHSRQVVAQALDVPSELLVVRTVHAAACKSTFQRLEESDIHPSVVYFQTPVEVDLTRSVSYED